MRSDCIVHRLLIMPSFQRLSLTLERLEQSWTLWLDWSLRLSWSTSLLSKQVKQVQLRSRLVENSGLDTESIARSVEVDTSHLRSLDTATQLSCGHSLTILTTEPKSSLETRADTIGVTIVDTTSNKATQTIVTVTIQLDTSSEGGAHTPLTIANLSGQTKLWYNLTIGINSSSQTGFEAQITVATKQTVSSCHSSYSSQPTSCKCVL